MYSIFCMKIMLVATCLVYYFCSSTLFKPLPSLMDLSPMLCTHIDVETWGGLEEPPLATTVDLWGISTPTTHCLAKAQGILPVEIFVRQSGPMWSTISAAMSVFQLSHLLLLSHVRIDD